MHTVYRMPYQASFSRAPNNTPIETPQTNSPRGSIIKQGVFVNGPENINTVPSQDMLTYQIKAPNNTPAVTPLNGSRSGSFAFPTSVQGAGPKSSAPILDPAIFSALILESMQATVVGKLGGGWVGDISYTAPEQTPTYAGQTSNANNRYSSGNGSNIQSFPSQPSQPQSFQPQSFQPQSFQPQSFQPQLRPFQQQQQQQQQQLVRSFTQEDGDDMEDDGEYEDDDDDEGYWGEGLNLYHILFTNIHTISILCSYYIYTEFIP